MQLRINFIGFFPQDMTKMVAFYRDVLGMKLKGGSEAGPYAEFENEGVRLAMYQRALLPELLGQTPGYPKGLNGSFELGIPAGAKDNVDTIFAHLTANGATPVYEPRDEPWNMRSAMAADPEGNLLEIYSDFWA